jgi:hypothetical protein
MLYYRNALPDTTAGSYMLQCLLVGWYVVYRWQRLRQSIDVGGLQPSHLTEGHQVVVLGCSMNTLQSQLWCAATATRWLVFYPVFNLIATTLWSRMRACV